MRSLDLFAGGGGSILSGKLLGWQCRGAVEFSPYCQKVLRARQDDGTFEPFEIFGDIRKFDCKPWRGSVDVITAGFPCQPFSKAGKQRGADDDRNMWPSAARCIREVRPPWVFLENVPALLSSGYFTQVLGDLAACGFDASWGVLGAKDVGAPHKRRDRLWIVGRSLANLDSMRQSQQATEGDAERGRAVNCGEAAGIPNTQDSRPQRGIKGLDLKRQAHVERRCEWWREDPADAPAESRVVRMVHGVAHRRHRITALGNGWVPEVAYHAWHQLSQRVIDAQKET